MNYQNMFKHFMRQKIKFLFLFLGLPLLSVAGESDFKEPIKVSSEHQFIDGKNKTSVFEKDVFISQGSLEIRANKVEVIATDGEGREIFIASGNPATYIQKMDDGSNVQAQANEMKYAVDIRTITMSGDARLQQNSSMVKGESITFDMEREQMIATSSKDGTNRVTTVFSAEAMPNKKKLPDVSVPVK